jgi:peptidoglycan/LPS O-acetylase OafA/YrhL
MDWLLADSNRIPPRFVQVHLIAIELRQIWRGVNAPTFPFNLAGQRDFQLLGLSIAEIFYLIAVAVLWYVCGILATNKKSEPSTHATPYQRSRIVALAILFWGVILFVLSILQVPQAFPWTFAFGRIFRPIPLIVGVLYAVWAIVLIRFGVKHVGVSLRTHQGIAPSKLA